MQQFNLTEWFNTDHSFKGEEVLPQNLEESTMWQMISMMPLKDEFIKKNVNNLDLPLLFLNDRITRDVLMEILPDIIDFVIEEPDTIDDIIGYIEFIVSSSLTEYTDEEEAEFGELLLMTIGEKYKQLEELNDPFMLEGSFNTCHAIAKSAENMYLDIISTSDKLSIENLHPASRLVFIMTNIHFDLNTIDWRYINYYEYIEIINDYGGYLLSPHRHIEVLLHTTRFIELAAVNQDLLAK